MYRDSGTASKGGRAAFAEMASRPAKTSGSRRRRVKHRNVTGAPAAEGRHAGSNPAALSPAATPPEATLLASHGEHKQVWTAPEVALALDALVAMPLGATCAPQSSGSPVFGRFSATEGKSLAEPAATSSGEDARGLHLR